MAEARSLVNALGVDKISVTKVIWRLDVHLCAMLTKGFVRYLPWEKCISKAQELQEEPEVKGLRLTEGGLLYQDVGKDPTTDLSGELLWDYALRRRAVAGDISGLITFETMDLWHETLKENIWSQRSTATSASATTSFCGPTRRCLSSLPTNAEPPVSVPYPDRAWPSSKKPG